MTAINRLSDVDELSLSDYLVIYDFSNSDTRKTSMSDFLDLFINEFAGAVLTGNTAFRALETDSEGDIVSSDVTSTELNYLQGVTSAIQTQLDAKLENVVEDLSPQLGANLDINSFTIAGYTADRALQTDGSGAVEVSLVTSTELGYLDGVTSALQTQLDAKLENVVEDLSPQLGANLDINGNTLSGFTASRALETDGSGLLQVSAVTSVELNYLDGVTSALQTQLDAKLENVVEDLSPQLGANLDVNSFTVDGYTADRALQTDGSGGIEVSLVTSTELGYLDGVTSNVQTQINNISTINPSVIINGDFRVSQRGTSVTGASYGDYFVDRFSYAAVHDGVVDISREGSLDANRPFYFYGQIDVTTADASLGAGQYAAMQYNVEGFDVSDFGFGDSGAIDITLSFYHAHTKTGTHCVAFRNHDSSRTYIAEYTQSVSDTWEQSTITLTGDTSGSWNVGIGIGLNIVFTAAVSSTYQTTADSWQAGSYLGTSNQVNSLDNTSNFFRIGHVKLEKGDSATAFISTPVQETVAQCRRYYKRLAADNISDFFGDGYAFDSNSALIFGYCIPSMRIDSPTISVSSASHFSIFYRATAVGAASIIQGTETKDAWRLNVTTSSSVLTAGDAVQLGSSNAAAYIEFDAEL